MDMMVSREMNRTYLAGSALAVVTCLLSSSVPVVCSCRLRPIIIMIDYNKDISLIIIKSFVVNANQMKGKRIIN